MNKQYFSSDQVMNASGLIAMAISLALTVTLQDTSAARLLVTGLSLATLACFVLFVLDQQRERRLQLWIFGLQSALILALYLVAVNSFIAILGIVWIVQAEELFGARRSIALLIISAVTYGVIFTWQSPDTFSAVSSAALFSLFQMFALTTAHRTSSERELRKQTAALNRELLATRQLLSQSVAQGERVRIARDLHDILGHHMTALILNLEVASQTASCRENSESVGQMQEKVDQALAMARLLLSDIRTAVSELREDDSINLGLAIDKLLADIPQPRFTVSLDESLKVTDINLAQTLLRCTQEAITNVIRHSNARECRIDMTASQDQLQLIISDDGKVSTGIVPGNGLKGMLERVEQAGGNLHWQACAKGFVLTASFPLKGLA